MAVNKQSDGGHWRTRIIVHSVRHFISFILDLDKETLPSQPIQSWCCNKRFIYRCATYTLPLRNSKVAVAQEQPCCCAAANNFSCYQHESGPTACHESEKYRLLYLRRLVMACRWQILHDTTDRTLCPPQTNWKSINNRPSTEGAEGFSFPLPLLTNKKKQLLIKKTRKHFAVSKKRRTFASQLRNRCTLSSVGRAIDS